MFISYKNKFVDNVLKLFFHQLQVEEIRDMIDKIQVNVETVKKTHSEILSAPQNDESKYLFYLTNLCDADVYYLISNYI